VVRIQRDRGHTIVRAGPYAYLRHPGYLGLLAFTLATPLLLGSLWALLPAAGVVGVVIVRTALEDRTLQEELPGYDEYSRLVRFRLLPGMW
jgi:protein-S-isoprenylcysteine O-methyltransferase Ste14